jgi:DNA-binding CsgD family transcriptional regulator
MGKPMQESTQLCDSSPKRDIRFGLSEDERDILDKITAKQREALRMTLVGKTSKEIAMELGIAPRSVDQRLDSARIILGAATRASAARKFFDLHCASEGLTSDPFMLGGTGSEQRGEPGEQSTYVFGDALQFSPNAIWEHRADLDELTWRRFVPGLPSATSSSKDRIMWIMIGATSLLTLVLIGLAVVESLKRVIAAG